MATGRNPGIRVPAPSEAHPGVIAAIQQIIKEFGWQSSPMFASLALSGLTATRLVATDSSSILSSLAAMTDHSVILGNGSTVKALGVATNGQLPIGSTGADPVLAAISEGTGVTVTNGAGSISIAVNAAGVNHNSLGGLQGGTAAQYYHLTATEHGYVSGANAQSVLTTADPTFTGLNLDEYLDLDIINTVAAGKNCIYLDAVQETNALTGTLRGVYSVVTNGELASSGTIRAFEGKARAATSGLVGGNVGTLEGMSLSADAKNKTITTLRGAEIIMDGQSGAAVTTAVGLRVANNFQANIATTSYGLQIYRDSFDYTADIILSKGGTIAGDSYLNQDCRTTGTPTFAGLTVTNYLSQDTDSVALGYLAGAAGLPDNSVFIGLSAGNIASGANLCVFIGRYAGEGKTTDIANSGTANTGVGGSSLRYCTTGGYNCAFGYGSLTSLTEGIHNNAQGYASGAYLTTGSYNCYQGRESGNYNATGSYNTYLGSYAGYGVTGNSNSFNTGIGSNSLRDITTGTLNTCIGYAAGYANTTGYNNDSLGAGSLRYNTTGYNNNAMGTDSLRNNTTGNYNNAMGVYSLRYNTTGSYNNAMGTSSLHYNTTGSYNSAMGASSLYALSPTSAAITAFADYSGTVAGTVKATSVGHGLVGVSTKQISGTVNYNGAKSITVIDADNFYFTATWVATEQGWWAVDAEGQKNTGVGSYSGYSLTTGSSNVFLGAYAGRRQTTASSLLIVDNQDRSSAAGELANALLYGTFDATGTSQTLRCNGKFGVNINPLEEIHAADTVRADTAFNLNGTDGVTQTAAAGKVCDVTALAGGIATAQTQITYAADGTYNFDATSGKVSSITITNGRITAITTAA